MMQINEGINLAGDLLHKIQTDPNYLPSEEDSAEIKYAFRHGYFHTHGAALCHGEFDEVQSEIARGLWADCAQSLPCPSCS